MKKIILTESQLNMIRKQLNEGVSDVYSREVKTDIMIGGTTYKGKEINDVSNYNIRINYSIDIEAREWGIKDISLYDIHGPEEIELEIEYFVDDLNTDTEVVTMPIDWDKLEQDTYSGEGVVTIGDVLEINLSNDESGNLIFTKIILPVYTL